MNILKMTDLKLATQRVLIRADLNIPIQNSQITNDIRILASLPTIKYALAANAKVMVTSHLGHPTEGLYDEQFSLKPIVDYISNLLGKKIRLIKDWIDSVFNVANGELVILENVRFNKGEKKDDPVLSKKMAALCDIYVMDAFGTAHRTQASTHGVGKFAKIACAGSLLISELKTLTALANNIKRPMCAIIGGSKVSTKLKILESLVVMFDKIIVGGGIANTFLAAAGYNIGQSLYEKYLIPNAKALQNNIDVLTPIDVLCGKKFNTNEHAMVKLVSAVEDDDIIFDIGPKTQKLFDTILKSCKTILWNGPVGVFEFNQFSEGTRSISLAIAKSDSFSIVGGGDTIAAIHKYGINNKISYISSGGSAFLTFIEGKKLPAVAMLEAAYS